MTDLPKGDRTIGLALSGGGHRATAFELGALLALADHQLNTRVASISSVSGGSIANGIALSGCDYGTVTADEFERVIAPRLSCIARRGVLLGGAPATRVYLWLVMASGALLACSVLLVAVSSVAGLRLFGAVAIVVAILSASAGWSLVRQRSQRTEAAIDKELLGGTNSLLAAFQRTVHHVFCTTELQTGESFYFSPRMVYGYRYGHGQPHGVPLSTVVQASACVPGAFNPRVLRLEPLAMSKDSGVAHVVLNDGGTYDNMADQWEYGHAGRSREWPQLAQLQRPVDLLVLVNASKGWDQVDPIRPSGRALELAGLQRSQSVQYDVSTARRRQALYREFVQADESRSGLTGAFVQISRSPYAIVEDFSRGDADGEPTALSGQRQQRAVAAGKFLDDLGYSRDQWRDIAHANAAVPTTLARLDRRNAARSVTAELVEQGYVLTLVNLHVLHGLVPLVPFERARFARLCS